VTLLAFAATLTPAQAIDSASVDALVQDSLKAWRVPGVSVAIVQGDEVTYLKGAGVKEAAGARPVTPDTVFAIGSTTKAFTTAAMAILVDEGKMNWDDPVRQHVPFFRLSDPLADQNVSLRDIVCHRTGLSRNDMLWYASPWGRDEIIRKIGFVRLSRPFRYTYQYQNIMFLTAGQAVGLAAKTTWEDFIQRRLFDPLGMSGSNFSTTAAEAAADHATPHRKNKQDVVEAIAWRNIDNVGPAGSINSSAHDLAKWVRLHLGDGTFEGRRIVSGTNLAETRTPQMVIRLEGPARAFNPDTDLMSYGMGWVIQDYRGNTIVSHGGAIDGFRARIVLVPKAKAGIVVLSNLGQTQMPEALSNGIVDLLLGLPKKDWNGYLIEQVKKMENEQKAREREREEKRHKGTRPSRELAAYAGAYEDPGYGKVTVSLEDRSLFVQWSTFKSRLDHYHFDTFSAAGDNALEGEQVVFVLGSDGEVSGLGFLGVDFKRPKPKAASAAAR
jgi:CubicO group peptidase (beta-lactamase class C family)